MGFFFHLLPYGFILQAIAIVHFIRRRPDTYWLWVTIFLGGFGALVYIAVEVVPDLGMLRGAVRVFPRRQRIRELEALVRDNPSAGNYEELGGLYLDDGNYSRARVCFDRAISSRTDSLDPFYRRALAELELKDYAAAVPDLEQVVAREANYDFHRVAGLLAYAHWQTGNVARADEIQFLYASFLASQGRKEDARQWVERILAKKLGSGIPASPRASLVSPGRCLDAPPFPRRSQEFCYRRRLAFSRACTRGLGRED